MVYIMVYTIDIYHKGGNFLPTWTERHTHKTTRTLAGSRSHTGKGERGRRRLGGRGRGYTQVYTMVYMMVYTLLCIMVYHDDILVYTTLCLMVYTMIYTMIWLIHTTLRYRDCTGPHARTYCARQHATATSTASYVHPSIAGHSTTEWLVF
jgi:hypothetical protein